MAAYHKACYNGLQFRVSLRRFRLVVTSLFIIIIVVYALLPASSTSDEDNLRDNYKQLRNSTDITVDDTVYDPIAIEFDVCDRKQHNSDSSIDGIPHFPNCPQPLLTLVTSFKPSKKKKRLYLRTIHNWAQLRPFVQPVLFQSPDDDIDSDLLRKAHDLGWILADVPEVGDNTSLPVLKSLFLRSFKLVQSRFYGFLNGDILIADGLVETLCYLNENLPWSEFLLVARRINFNLTEYSAANEKEGVVDFARKSGKLFIPNSVELFITSATSYPWPDVPAFVIGRVAFDNWLPANGLLRNISVVDITRTTPLLHQTDSDGNKAGRDTVQSLYDQKYNVRLVDDIELFTLGRLTCAPYVTIWDSFRRPALMHGDTNIDPLCPRNYRKYNVSRKFFIKNCPTCKQITNIAGET